jgi:UPF0755 protein
VGERRAARGCGCLLFALVLLAAAAATPYLFLRSIGLIGERTPGPKTVIAVPRGASAADIGRLLEHEGVIPSELGFRIAAYLEDGDEIQAGRYLLRRNLSPRAALRLLTRGPRAEEFVTVTFPEGSWLTDFARIVSRETHISGPRFLRLARGGRVRSALQPGSVDTLEGLLFPSTYEVIRRDDARSLLVRLVEQLETEVAELDLARMKSLGYTPYEVVIVASMIEAEAKVPADRPRIAAVIYNRLDSGMKLGIDATVSYAVGEHRRSLDEDDLAIDSPYNTRRYPGLPPTPIGAPGRAALEASAHPAAGDWLYYVVSDCRGRHAFSTSYRDFLADKAAYRALRC